MPPSVKSIAVPSRFYNLYAAGVTTTTPGAQVYTADTSTLAKRVGLHWTPKSWLTLSGSLSDNDIHNNGTGTVSSATARDTQLSAQLAPFRNVRFTYSYTQSDTGNVSLNTVTNGTTTTGGTTTTTGTTSTTATGGTATTTTTGTTTSYLPTPVRSAGRGTRDVVVGNTTGTTNSYSNIGSLGAGPRTSVWGAMATTAAIPGWTA